MFNLLLDVCFVSVCLGGFCGFGLFVVVVMLSVFKKYIKGLDVIFCHLVFTFL